MYKSYNKIIELIKNNKISIINNLDLESIEVYTTHDNVFLAEVFIAMGKSKEALPSEKDPKAVTAYFKKVFPSMDFERVYPSDMKKMVKWFGQLKANNIEPVLPVDEEPEA